MLMLIFGRAWWTDVVNYGANDFGGVKTRTKGVDGGAAGNGEQLAPFEASVLDAVRWEAEGLDAQWAAVEREVGEDGGDGGRSGGGQVDGTGAARGGTTDKAPEAAASVESVGTMPPVALREQMWWGLTNSWEGGLVSELKAEWGRRRTRGEKEQTET